MQPNILLYEDDKKYVWGTKMSIYLENITTEVFSIKATIIELKQHRQPCTGAWTWVELCLHIRMSVGALRTRCCWQMIDFNCIIRSPTTARLGHTEKRRAHLTTDDHMVVSWIWWTIPDKKTKINKWMCATLTALTVIVYICVVMFSCEPLVPLGQFSFSFVQWYCKFCLGSVGICPIPMLYNPARLDMRPVSLHLGKLYLPI